MQVDTLTPDSGYSNYTDNRSLTSYTPSTQLTSPGSMLSRKATPPSPEMQLPWDNPFPAFTPTRSPEKARKLASNAQNESKPNDTNFARPEMLPGAQVLNRMDKIATGPFGGRSKQPQPTLPEVSITTGPSVASPKQFHNSKGREHFMRPPTSQSQRSGPSNPDALLGPAQQPPLQDGQQSMRPPPWRPVRPAEAPDRFLERLQSETEPPPLLTTASRSQTFPEATKKRQPDPAPMFQSENPTVQIPFDQPQSEAGLDRPKYNPYGYEQSEVQSSNPPFGSSRPRSRSFGSLTGRIDRRRPRDPPVPLVPGMLRQESDKSLQSNGSHSTSDSSSSAYSMTSNPRSQASSNTSWGGGDRTTVGRSQSDASSLSSSRRNRSGTNRSVASSKSSEPSLRGSERPQPLFSRGEPPDSPIDPAIQFGLGGRQHLNILSRRPSEPTSTSSSPPRERTEPRGHSREPDISLPQRTPTTRGPCHACQRQIVVGERSVKDSTGRLSGRYHKACFVCKTCSAPFLTGEFYVHNDSPYCARHWHECNGSLCRGCDNGIEGQYLETDRKEKYHTTCFRCTTCRSKLDEEYFEVDGKPFCERHSWAFGPRNNGNLGLPGGGFGAGQRYGRSPEKRKTRLMMMMA